MVNAHLFAIGSFVVNVSLDQMSFNGIEELIQEKKDFNAQNATRNLCDQTIYQNT